MVHIGRDLSSGSSDESEPNVNLTPYVVAAMTACLIVIMLFVGVVLPAVWSQRADRRCAAARVLDKILEAAVKVLIASRFVLGA